MQQVDLTARRVFQKVRRFGARGEPCVAVGTIEMLRFRPRRPVRDEESECKTGEKGESGFQKLLRGNCLGVEGNKMKFARLIPDVNDSSKFALRSGVEATADRHPASTQDR